MDVKMKVKPLILVVSSGLIIAALLLLRFWSKSGENVNTFRHLFLRSVDNKVIDLTSNPSALPRDTRCTYHTCFDVYHCGYNDKTKISVYVYPVSEYVDQRGNAITLPVSKEFYEMLEAIADSPFYTNDPESACLFIPSIDVLNQNSIRLKELGQVLASLQWYGITYSQLSLTCKLSKILQYK